MKPIKISIDLEIYPSTIMTLICLLLSLLGVQFISYEEIPKIIIEDRINSSEPTIN